MVAALVLLDAHVAHGALLRVGQDPVRGLGHGVALVPPLRKLPRKKVGQGRKEGV